MKILWICNTCLEDAAQSISLGNSVKPESWVAGIFNSIISKSNIDIVFVFRNAKNGLCFEYKGAKFISFREPTNNHDASLLTSFFVNLYNDEKPDVIHCFGTECRHASIAALAANQSGFKNRFVISIQGMVSYISMHFKGFLPESVCKRKSFRDLIKHDSIENGSKSFKKRGKYEIEAIQMSDHIIGRTDWDEACTKRINPKIHYYKCNENLRDSFYGEKKWSFVGCEKHSIFVSQSSYPLKGFHLMLKAFINIAKMYPDAHLYTTGEDLYNLSFKRRLAQPYYKKYILSFIKRNNLEKRVTFLGYLNEEQMLKRYLKTNVFVSCSTIENSPNSLGEAMILGVPCISSDVGGVKNMMVHSKEGFLYPADEYYMIEYYASLIFDNIVDVDSMTNAAIAHANKTHDKNNNAETLLKIYRTICFKNVD